LARNGAGPVPVGNGAGIDVTEHHLFSRLQTKPQDIRAELSGSDTCTAAGITARGTTPVLSLCRQLLAAGLDPDRAMEVYRGATLALRIRSIGEAAGLEINSKGTGFVRTAPPARFRDKPEPQPVLTTHTGPIIGLHVRLDRTIDIPCGVCGETAVVIGEGSGLHCASCNRRRGSLPEAFAKFLVAVVRRFGKPTEAITIRNSTKFAQANEAALTGAGVASIPRALWQRKGKRHAKRTEF
jgi:hypothetical protein